jgi:radical SAM superfamily enzyme YgiQ (UPF0313 family)
MQSREKAVETWIPTVVAALMYPMVVKPSEVSRKCGQGCSVCSCTMFFDVIKPELCCVCVCVCVEG